MIDVTAIEQITDEAAIKRLAEQCEALATFARAQYEYVKAVKYGRDTPTRQAPEGDFQRARNDARAALPDVITF